MTILCRLPLKREIPLDNYAENPLVETATENPRRFPSVWISGVQSSAPTRGCSFSRGACGAAFSAVGVRCTHHQYIYIYTHTYTSTHIYIYIYIRIYIYIYTHVYLHICMCVYIYIYICLSLSLYIYIYTYISLSLCMYVYIYIYIYIHTCTHIHIPLPRKAVHVNVLPPFLTGRYLSIVVVSYRGTYHSMCIRVI